MTIRAYISGALAAATLFAAAPAMATPIMLGSGDVGESYTIDFDGFVDGDQPVGDLGARLVLTLTGVTGTSYNFDYALTNTTDTANGIASRVTSFAINTSPNLKSATSTGSYANVVTYSNYPNQIGEVDACFKAKKSGSCAGNGGGQDAGTTGTGTLSLDFASAPTSLTIDEFFVRYQGISGAGNVTSASGRSTGDSSSSSSTGGTSVPEPGMLLLFGLVAIALGLRRRWAFPKRVRGPQPAVA
jgi:hypothetical protein